MLRRLGFSRLAARIEPQLLAIDRLQLATQRPGRCCSTRSARAWSNWRARRSRTCCHESRCRWPRMPCGNRGTARRSRATTRDVGAGDATRGRRDEPPAGRGFHRRARAGSPRGPLRRRSRRHHDVFDPRRRSWLRAALGARRRHCDADPLPRDRRADRSGDGAGPGGPDPRALRCAHGVRDDDDPDRREPRHDRGGVRRHRVGSRPRRRPPHRQRARSRRPASRGS